MRTQIRFFLVGIAVLTGATACGKGTGSPSAKPPTSTSIAPLPSAAGTPVLDITSPGHAAINVDFATLDGLATKTYSVVEPFEKKTIAFKGVELSTVLAAAGVPKTAKSVHFTALDDYRVEITMADIQKGGVILATEANGAPIPIDHGGPSRIIFLDGVEAGSNPDQWVWSIAHIVAT